MRGRIRSRRRGSNILNPAPGAEDDSLGYEFSRQPLVEGSPEERTLQYWLEQGEALGMSAIGLAEFLCGPVDFRQLRKALPLLIGEPVLFLDEDAERAAHFFNRAGRRRGSMVDCMIAAVAVRAKAKLATSNQKGFARFTGLELAG